MALGKICIRLHLSLHIVARSIISLKNKAEIQLRVKSNLKAFVFLARQLLSLESKAPRATFNVHFEDYKLYTKLIKFLTSRLANDRYLKRMSTNASEKLYFVESFRIYGATSTSSRRTNLFLFKIIFP